MHCLHRISLAVFALVFLVATAWALGPTLPSSMLDVSVDGPVSHAEGYIYVDARNGPPWDISAYPITLNSDGEIVAFHAPQFDPPVISNWQPIEDSGVFTMVRGDLNGAESIEILDANYELLRTIPGTNPFNDTLALDGHEVWIGPDGHSWTLWRHYFPVDMSQILPGGEPTAFVIGNDIERWDEDGNLVWSWRSMDHLDVIPLDGVDNINILYGFYIEYMHTNAFQVIDDEKLLLSVRSMSVIIMIDIPTGEIDWILGGGPLNQFTFTGNGGTLPLDLSFQHDARLLSDTELTVFDNGNTNNPVRTSARDYIIDTDAMTAELTWYYAHPDFIYAPTQGSYRKASDGSRVIDWGGATGFTDVTWLDANDQIRLELGLDFGQSYRAYWTEHAPLADRPYLMAEYEDGDTFAELVCNWWGHEDEVAGYEIHAGMLWTPPSVGITETGTYPLTGITNSDGLVVTVRALNGDGDPISPFSNRLLFNEADLASLVTEPLVDDVPPSGGTVTYSLALTAPFPNAVPGVTFWTTVTLPNGTELGPLNSVPFTLPANADIAIPELTQAVPGFAPSGEYVHTARVGLYPTAVLVEDSFTFEKAGVMAGETGDLVAWRGGGFEEFGEVTPRDNRAVLPDRFTLLPAMPNPFNPTTTVAVSLPRASELTVRVYDTLGREVATLSEDQRAAGTHRFSVDGRQWASGVYFVRASVPGLGEQVSKIMLMK